jgi:hypothetical protein
VTAPVQLAPESIDALAEALAHRIVELALDSEAVQFIDATEVAHRFGVSRDWVYEHAEELGAVRVGKGSRPRLRFDAKKVREGFGSLAGSRTAQRTKRSAVRRGSDVELLPIKGDTSAGQVP